LAAASRKAVGGGSEEHSVDFFDKIRSCRKAFMGRYPDLESIDLLNYGAPRQPELEFDSDFPAYCREYIKFIISQSEHTVIKFTRMYCKVRALWEMDPDAKFIHVVRDPRSVAVSYLFGKHQKNKHLFPNEKVFFGRISNKTSWSSFPFSEIILNSPEYAHLKGCEDFMRILLLWKYKFAKTHEAGKALFGKNYLLFRHEDFLLTPRETLRVLYDFLGRELPQGVADWALKRVQSNHSRYAPNNKEWRRAFKRLAMDQELSIAGYSWRSSWDGLKGITIKTCRRFCKKDHRT
jgi:hypothetical protein